MFGYVAPQLSSLTEEQKQRYRDFYCGVCHALKVRHGQIGRVSLSNDMTFLAMLLSSLYEPETSLTESRCAVHPLKSHGYLSSPMVDYAADMNALLFYFKCVDQRMDERSLRGTAGEKAFSGALEKIRSLYPKQTGEVEEALRALWEEEKKQEASPDRLCNLSGEMLGAVFVPKQEDLWAPALRDLGNGLGRFIYWMDAWEDYDEDRKKDRFNPLTSFHDREDYEDFCRETMEMMIADAAERFEILPLEQDLDILRNILYSGVWQKYAMIMNRQQKRKEGSHGQ